MEKSQQKQIKEAASRFLNEGMERVILSNPVFPDRMSKVKIRPVLLKEGLCFQAEEQVGAQAFHRNLNREEAAEYVAEKMEKAFRQCEMASASETGLILVSKKGKPSIKIKKRTGAAPVRIQPAHNRKKRYILEEGRAVPFLVDLGVMTESGQIVRSRYDKFRQINRFLEMIEDVLPELPADQKLHIIDFGCGKSYLTFAVYYYLNILKGYQVQITGLDLKEDVIRHCGQLSRKYGYHDLTFLQGDIAGYEGADQVDMVITLHACDLATDYALEKAVKWGAKVILSVPCCQHELNRQMKNELMAPVFGYGLIRERMAALYTDAIRAQVLEYRGYGTQILEFIDMEHTPKNILIRAVKGKGKGRNGEEIRRLLDFLQIEPAIVRLLAPELLRDGES